MNSTTHDAKDTFQDISNSLPKKGTPTKHDIESATDESATTTSRTSFAKGVFTQLLESIHDRRYHVDYEKRVVYRKLMDQLDSVEPTPLSFNLALMAIELIVFSGLTAALICSLTIHQLNHRRLLRLRLWQWITMAMMLSSGLSVIRFITFAVSWPINWWFRIHKYVVYFTRQLKRCVDVTLWFCIILLGWYLWFRPRLRHVHGDISMVASHQVTRFLMALCIGSFLWLLKNILYLKLEADLHYDQLFERLRLTVAYLHGVQIVHNRGMWKFLADNKCKRRLMKMKKGKEEADKDVLMKGENIWMEVLKMEKETVPIWVLRRLCEEYLEQVTLRPLPGNSDLTKNDQKMLREAKKMFKQLIFNRIPNIHLDHLSDHEIKREDLKEYGLTEMELDIIFKPKKQEDKDEEDESNVEAHGNESVGDRVISYDEFLNWAIRAYKNCWGLERTLYSSKRVFIKLNRLLSAFLVMVVVIIWLLLSEIVNTAQLALLFTPFLAASFIFGDSCKKMFEGLILAFAMHPFDVGDRVIINDVQMRVTGMNILTSVFHKYDTGEEVIIPNSTLTSTSIINLDITPDQGDKLEFVVNAQTPLEDIHDLEIKIKKLLDDDIEYSSNNKVVKSDIGKEEVKMTVYFKYLVSYLTAETKAVHKSKILSKIMKFQKGMEREWKVYPPSYVPYSVIITLANKIKLEEIEQVQVEIMRGLEERYEPYSKVVMTELTKSVMKMDLYVRDSVYREVKEEGEEKDEDEIRRKKIWGKACRDKEMMNLKDICESLKRKKKVVKEVKILDENGEVVAQGGIGWGSLHASDVVQSNNSLTTSQNICAHIDGVNQSTKSQQN